MTKTIQALRSDRLLLRAIASSDLANVYQGLSHPQVIKYYGVSYDSLDATEEQMRWYEASEQYWWAICSPDNQHFYGAGGLNDVSTKHSKAEVGLWLLPEYWGKGIMTEVIPLICNYGFKELGLHRIEGFVDAANANCKRAMAKLDFKHEGTMQDCEVKHGAFVSIDIYALLNQTGR